MSSSKEEEARAVTLQLVSAYGALLGQKRWDEWIELWAEEGELCFPFAPLGRKSVYRGRAQILAYMSAVGRVAADALGTIRLFRCRTRTSRWRSSPSKDTPR